MSRLPARSAFVRFLMAACACVALMTQHAAGQLSTAFTYQGELNVSGSPFTGTADFEFRLFHQADSATQVGATWATPGVNVAQGLFTVDLNFGANPFTGDARWLEIRVRAPAGGGAYTTLSPRHRLSATPYAIYALTAGSSSPFIYNGANAVFSGGDVGIGTTAPAANLHIDGTGSSSVGFQITNPGSSTGVFTIGSPLGNLGIATFANNGKRRDIRFTDTGISLSVSTSSSAGGSDNGLFVHENANVGIGTLNPAARLHVLSGSSVGVTPHSNSSVVFERSGSNYVSILSPDANERGLLFGDPESFVNGGIIYNSSSAFDGFVFRTGGNVNRMWIMSNGHVGVGEVPFLNTRFNVHSLSQYAIRSTNASTTGVAYGAFATSASSEGVGVYGSGRTGVEGRSFSGGFDSKGVHGISFATDGAGVHGHATSGSTSSGLWGTNDSSGWAAYLQGDTRVVGSLFVTATKNFLIDNPANPENEYLVHSCVESDEMKNIYDGVVTLNEIGEAVVTLPDWFEHLNADFRYQLTCVGGYAPVYVKHELMNGSFVIAGEGSRAPGLKVSWQITGNRIDPAALASNFRTVIAKPESERGKFLTPAGYGRDESDRITRMANVSPRTIKPDTEGN